MELKIAVAQFTTCSFTLLQLSSTLPCVLSPSLFSKLFSLKHLQYEKHQHLSGLPPQSLSILTILTKKVTFKFLNLSNKYQSKKNLRIPANTFNLKSERPLIKEIYIYVQKWGFKPMPSSRQLTFFFLFCQQTLLYHKCKNEKGLKSFYYLFPVFSYYFTISNNSTPIIVRCT